MATALLVVDAQKIYTAKGSELYCQAASKTIDQINALIDAFQKRRWPVILVRHVHRLDGSDLGRMFDFSGEAEEDFNFKAGSEEVQYDERLKRPTAPLELQKTRYSSFVGTGLDNHLRGLGVDTVVVCGFMTNFCCESTARDAHDLDYFVDFIADATGTPGTDNLGQSELRKVVGELLGAGFARVHSTKSYLKTLSR